MLTSLARWRAYPSELGFAVLFAAVFLSYSTAYHLPVYPGYFLLQTTGMVLFIGWLRAWGKREERLPAVLLPLLLWFVWSLATALWAQTPWAVAEGVLRNTTLFFLTLGLGWLLRRAVSLRKWFWPIALAVQIPLALAYARTILSRPFGQFGFPFANANVAGTILGFCVALAAGIALFRLRLHAHKSACCYAALALCLGGVVVLCGAKSGLLSMLAVLLLMLLILYPRLSWLWGICVAGSVLISLLVWSQLAHRLWPSLEVRLFVWEAGWRMATADWTRLLFGWGTGNFFANFPDFVAARFFTAHYQAPVVDFPHNFFLEILIEQGVIGLLLWCWLLVQLLSCAWRQFVGSESADIKVYSIGIIAAISMLCLDSLSSLSMSYAQCQLLLAMSLAWLSATYPVPPARVTKNAPCLVGWLWLLALPVLLLFWKYYTWDTLIFHRDYRSAVRAREASQKLERMLAVELPVLENYQTLQWRNDLGALLVDCYEQNPQAIRAAAGPFLEIERKMPKFGFFLLYRALWEAKQGHCEAADNYFTQAAHKNPFSLDQWVWWSKACENGDADVSRMAAIVRELRKTYGEDGALLLGEALVYHLAGDKESAVKRMAQIRAWCENRYDSRSRELSRLSQEFLRRNG
jgi:O-antigen ligase